MSRKKDALTQRMKDYEGQTKYKFYLTMDEALVVRLDGKNCSNWTKDFNKPYDYLFSNCMKKTLQYLVENVPNCIVGWTHSDEISLIIKRPNEKSNLWFDGAFQKIITVCTSMATMKFNNLFYVANCVNSTAKGFTGEVIRAHEDAAMKGLVFDGRAFVIPLDEVPNYLLCRQRDCIRNSIEGAARSWFSHNEIQGKNGSELKAMLFTLRDIDWEKQYPNDFKYGTLAYKVPKPVESCNGIEYRNEWKLTEVTPTLNYWNQNFLGEDFYEQIVQKDASVQGREQEEEQ